ncbi:MAG TPA: biotin-dependent carboxyltransferase family protein [Paracoccaceae bacterium]|nr:biotin-dependent carboxyltransferase family protein [Paracoccaceae bacterium]
MDAGAGMTAVLAIREPGPATTVQDAGRPGLQRFGVPPSGALDRESLALANALVGNPPDVAALEARYAGPDLTVEGGPALIALAGPAAGLRVTLPGETPREVPPAASVRVPAGTRVTVRPGREGCTWYLAVGGGFALAPALGALATYARAGLGGFEGRPLRAGDRVPLRGDAGAPERAVTPPPPPASPHPIRVVLGPQQDAFTDAALALFLATEWQVGQAADRMGVRLEGPELTHVRGHDIVSDGIFTGSIQVPGTRRPILLLADRQTTGGYPKIATAISADLPRLGQARVGDRIRFEAVTAAEAVQAARRAARSLEARLAAVAAARSGPPDAARLLSENLISGVVSMHD